MQRDRVISHLQSLGGRDAPTRAPHGVGGPLSDFTCKVPFVQVCSRGESVNPASMRAFYNNEFRGDGYARHEDSKDHPDYQLVRAFVEEFHLESGRCLEIGCGRGAFQDIVQDYTGVDLADVVRRYLHKPFYQCDARELPFSDSTFDAVWSIDTLEHVPQPEKALCEMRRVIRSGGVLLLAPAWHTRPWFAQGYPVRPFKGLDLWGKCIKATIPLRDHPLVRYPKVLTRRALRLLSFNISPHPISLKYRRLKPNYDYFYMPDSDAVNSLDPFDVLLWFVSRGDRYYGPPHPFRSILFRRRALAFKVCK